MSDIHDAETAPRSADHKGLFATLGLAGAFLASACCIGPLVLLTLGISGACVSNLTALEPYKPIFAVIALGFIGVGFGLSTPEQVREAAAVADGVVVGSALVRFLEEHPEGDLEARVRWLTSTT